ncbi:MAG: DUF5777 family beta-barrel protein [Sediminibacterium sp.]|nr:DUF5777 family beta-barrel protein [Sediminibacterium sp.]
MKRIISICLIILSVLSQELKAQEKDLLDLVDDGKKPHELVKNAFKSIRVINGHSMEFLAPGTMDFRILHRFGNFNQGTSNLFGLDQASMRMGFDFGLTNYLQIGVGRSTFKKEVDGYIKYGILRQSTGDRSFPITIALVGGITMNTLPFSDPTAKNYFSSRLAYYAQTIFGRKFGDKFTLQLTPTYVHTNLVPLAVDPNDVYALGFGGRVKLTNRMAFTWDYFYNLNGLTDDVTYNPLSVGVDIETGGHVFQLHVSNAAGMNERAFINETTDSWERVDLKFGFNLSRIFQIKKTRK